MKKYKYDKEQNVLVQQKAEGTSDFDYENTLLKIVEVSDELKSHLTSFPLFEKMEFENERDFVIKSILAEGGLSTVERAFIMPIKNVTVEKINDLIQKDGIEKGSISDGYHTFKDLYAHRVNLFIALCKSLLSESFYDDKIYKTRFDFENKYCGDGWFIMGINGGKGKQISYHLPMEVWDECSFVRTVDKVPDFDGHTSNDVLKRLKQL